MERLTLPFFLACCLPVLSAAYGEDLTQTDAGAVATAFAHGGKFKMLYDARQRPQSVLLHGRLFIVYNGDAKPTSSKKGSARPMLITYDPESRSFSKPERLGPSRSDHALQPHHLGRPGGYGG